MHCEEQTLANVRSLWTAVFGEPAEPDLDPKGMIERLVSGLPTPGYASLRRLGCISADPRARI